jgi:hypothetical protein
MAPLIIYLPPVLRYNGLGGSQPYDAGTHTFLALFQAVGTGGVEGSVPV